MGDYPKDLQHFFVAGISYKKSDSGTRSRFAISNEQYAWILAAAKQRGIAELFILSTCNRTEIYGIARDIEQLVVLLCEATGESTQLFHSIAYLHRGKEAVQHLFEVATGLDSQILGDYEIVGQIKLAIKFSKENQGIGPFIERLYNQSLQTSKLVKNNTALSSGTVSVSFAAIQYLKEQVRDVAAKNVLLIGTGKIGRNTCKNLVDYLGCRNITLVNRTYEKARELAQELNIRALPAEQLNEGIADADIIVVAANADEPIIRAAQLTAPKQQWIIDLSIPNNVHPEVADLPLKNLLNVDQLSRMKDETLQMRMNEVPKARTIISTQMAEFLDWCKMRKQLAVLGQVKIKLEEIHTCTTFTSSDDTAERIQKVLNTMAAKMRVRNERGCHYLEAINDFIAIGIN
ncbi:glutamyl-tRNA reductase [Flavihumibacter profundi]|uniref:glutamyl-tRNA reductase n=1 Tax=Flavihumibacter profundi TaxID=2716883 RepID=UPI001CC41AF1|nr:glutamyl-tRNA reductase [Flavihumibacter profundi]MBZ5858586.1 glutamyl-tRNA reductase [Flavihumibacter profundi]